MKVTLKLGSVSAKDAAHAMNSKISLIDTDAEFAGVTDKISEVGSGMLFVCADDNSLAEMMAAANAGCSAVLCTCTPSNVDKLGSVPVIECGNVAAALEMLAKEYYKRGHFKMIALSGSIGKTTTGEFINSVLKEKYKVCNANDRPKDKLKDALAMLDIPSQADFAIVELRPDEKEKIEKSQSNFMSDIKVITASGNGDGNLSDYSEIMRGIKPDGELVFSADDKFLFMSVPQSENVKCVSVYNEKAEFRAYNITREKDKTLFDAACGDKILKGLEIPAFGIHNVYSALFAIAVGMRYNMSDEEIANGLRNCRPKSQSQNIYSLGKFTMIDDSESMSTESAYSAVDSLCELAEKQGARKLALIGDIREIGADTRIVHEKLGAYVSKKIDVLFTFGVAAASIASSAELAGMNSDKIYVNIDIADPIASAKAIVDEVKPNDVLLIKCSRALAAEKIIAYIREQTQN